MPDRSPVQPGGVRSRALAIDLAKVLAANLIVWHHLAFYGPMSDRVATVWPAWIDWLARHGREAVPVFLVVGGYLAARSLAPQGRLRDGPSLFSRLADRHLRLSAPFAVVVGLAVAANLLAGRWMQHGSISAIEGPMQMLAHVFLVQDLVGVPALTAGAWYVAIDFQLYALLLGLLTLARRGEHQAWNRQRHGPWLVAALGAASLLLFNRAPALDSTGFYFFGAYALGALVAWWAPHAHRRPRLLLVAAVGALALWVEWRDRLAVALAVAAWLAVFVGTRPVPAGGPSSLGRALARWSERSYALFLVHFPVCLVVNAAFTRWAPPDAAVQTLGLLTAWLASLWAARAFHERVEQPMSRAISAWRQGNPAVDAAARQGRGLGVAS